MTLIKFEIDNKLKVEFENLCKEYDLEADTALNIIIEKICKDKYFAKVMFKFNDDTQIAMLETEKGQNLNKVFNNIDELLNDLNN